MRTVRPIPTAYIMALPRRRRGGRGASGVGLGSILGDQSGGGLHAEGFLRRLLEAVEGGGGVDTTLPRIRETVMAALDECLPLRAVFSTGEAWPGG